MCSIGEDDFGDTGGEHTMIAEPKIYPLNEVPVNEICKRCRERNVVVKLNFKDAQCEPCFFQYVRHKFRASLGSTRIIERNAKVLIVFDGSVESCVLFDIVRDAVAQEQFKRLTIQPVALYIDETFITEPDTKKCQTKFVEICDMMKTFNFEATCLVPIAHDIEVTTDECQPLESDDELKKRAFLQNLNKIKSRTAREDFLNVKRLNVMRWAAKLCNCKYIFVPAISQHIATDLLINVALGRGKSVANDISFCDSRNDEVKIIRPMRSITSLEVETYARLSKDIGEMTKNAERYKCIDSNPTSSIHNLTKQFINNLQENFASTVSTVFRTGDKISGAAATTISEDDTSVPKQICKFCHSELDYHDSVTLFATEYSRCVSACADQHEVNDVELMQQRAQHQVLGGSSDCGNDEDVNSLMQELCHGCRNIFRGLDSPKDLIP